MDDKADIAALACKFVAGCGIAWGTWVSEHWLQLMSGFFLVLTYATQVYFHLRKDRREEKFHQQQSNKPNSGQP